MVHVSSVLPASILSLLLVSSGQRSHPCAPPAFPGDRQARSAIPGFCSRLCRAGPHHGQSCSCLLRGGGQTFQGLLPGVEDARLLQEHGCWPLTPRDPCLSVSMLPHRSRLLRGSDPLTGGETSAKTLNSRQPETFGHCGGQTDGLQRCASTKPWILPPLPRCRGVRLQIIWSRVTCRWTQCDHKGP